MLFLVPNTATTVCQPNAAVKIRDVESITIGLIAASLLFRCVWLVRQASIYVIFTASVCLCNLSKVTYYSCVNIIKCCLFSFLTLVHSTEKHVVFMLCSCCVMCKFWKLVCCECLVLSFLKTLSASASATPSPHCYNIGKWMYIYSICTSTYL